MRHWAAVLGLLCAFPSFAIAGGAASITRVCALEVRGSSRQLRPSHRANIPTARSPRLLAASPRAEFLLLGDSMRLPDRPVKVESPVFYVVQTKESHSLPIPNMFLVQAKFNVLANGSLAATLFGFLDETGERNFAAVVDTDGSMRDLKMFPASRRVIAQAVSENLHVIGFSDGTIQCGDTLSKRVPSDPNDEIIDLVTSPEGDLIFVVSSFEITALNSKDLSVRRRIAAGRFTFSQSRELTLTPDGKGFLIWGNRSNEVELVEFSMKKFEITRSYRHPEKGNGHNLQTLTAGSSPWAIFTSSPVGSPLGKAILFPLNSSQQYEIIAWEEAGGSSFDFAISTDAKMTAIPSHHGKVLLVNREYGTSREVIFANENLETDIRKMAFFVREDKQYLRIVDHTGQVWEVTI